MKSTMFLTSVTCIDHAFIDTSGDIIGGSLAPTFYVTGDLTAVESVVIDFSKCKKQIKAIIDDNENGIDHKLWIINNYSNCVVEHLEDNYVRVDTPKYTIVGPRNMFYFSSNKISSYDEMSFDISSMLEAKIHGAKIHVDISPDIQYTVPYPKDVSFFRYTHGLKNSSSWGCQNIAHGHLSYIILDGGTPELQKRIANDLHNTMFLFKNNVQNDMFNEFIVKYRTNRGGFSILIKDTKAVKIEILDTETTIENIVEWVSNKYKEELNAHDVQMIYISEGLHKGACKIPS